MNERSELVWQILSLAPLRDPGRLQALGEALDSEPDFSFTHTGRSDPPARRLKSSVAELLTESAGRQDPHQPEIWFLARRETPHIRLDIYLADDGRLLRDMPHTLNAAISDPRWFDSVDRLAKLSGYLTRVADAAGAFYGYCAQSEILDQRQQQLERNAGPIFGGILRAGRVAEDLQRELPDVYWWNYFGPAFVERWSDRLDGLGASRERTPAGTVVVLGTESPFVYDMRAKRVDSYTWKAPFYAALGTDTFMHERQAQRGVGELVPDFEAHRRAAGFQASPVGKGQNFELRLVATKPTSIDAAAKWLARRKEITVPARLRKGASILYQNPDTAVQAGFVVEEVGEFAVLRFDLPLRKPSFFAVEAMPLCVELAEGHGMLVSMDGQTHGQAPNVTTLVAAWEKANLEAISSSVEAIPYMTRERSDRWWHYMRGKADLHKRLGDDVFVPKLVAVAPGRRTEDLRLHVTWTDGVPLVLPQCDLVTLLEGRRPSEFKIRGTVEYSDLRKALRPYLDSIEVDGLGELPLLKPERAKDAMAVFHEMPARSLDHVEVAPAAWVDVPIR